MEFSLLKVLYLFIYLINTAYVLIRTEILVQVNYLNFVFSLPLFHIPTIRLKKDEF